MQLLPILLVAILLARENGLQLIDLDPAWGEVVAVGCGPPLLILLGGWVILAACRRRLDRGGSARAILTADRTVHLMRLLALLHFAGAVLAFNWLDVVQSWTGGDLILVDELIALVPPLIVVLGSWWVYHPIERRVREALLIRRLDLGRPIYPMPGRVRYVMVMARTHLLLIFVPILLIVGMSETVQAIVTANAQSGWPQWATDLIVLGGAIVIFVFSPPLAAVTLDVQSLPEGPLRDDLEGICRRHRVKMRRLLLWNTNGMMINAAVMGLIGQLRYILLTDALVETMERRQIQAVMAHEIGHVRRNHMPWLAVSFLAAIAIIAVMIELPMSALVRSQPAWLEHSLPSLEVAASVVALLAALVLFGWISRRFERQADTFAAQHLSLTDGAGDSDSDEREHAQDTENENAPSEESQTSTQEPDRITLYAVDALIEALGSVAKLNAVRIERKSWRHGSIAWRQQYLRSIVGKPIGALPIDRVIVWLKLTAAVALAGIVALVIVEIQGQ